MSFFSRLSYSFGNEDWKTESRALKIKPDDRVICITASGDRPLHLLMEDCTELTSIDLNPIQNHLLNLKIAAMRCFDYEDYLAFLGATPKDNRREDLEKLFAFMQSETAQFWAKHKKMINKGVLYQGAVERLTKIVAFVFNLLRKKTIRRLFDFDDIEEQKKFVSEHWDRLWWRKGFEFALNKKVSRFIINDPGLQMNLEDSMSPGKYIYTRINESMKRTLVRENLLLSLVFKGKVDSPAYPPYLLKEGVDKIKSRLDRLSVKTQDIVSYLEEAPDNSIDCFSLSDVVSYITKDETKRLFRAIKRTAKPGARFSIRQFLSYHVIPEELESHFKRDLELEKDLEKEDSCFVYRFMVGEIIK